MLRAVQDRPTGREADGPGSQRFFGETRHLPDLVGTRLIVRPVAHHVSAERAVGHLRGDVEHARHRVHGVEILGKALPLPVDSLDQGRARDVLDALHELDEELLTAWPTRREADAAVPHHDGGGTVPTRRRNLRVPGDLTVVMGVDVDPAGSDHQSVGIDPTPSRSIDCADFGDDAVGDRDVGRPWFGTRAVDNGAVGDDQIVHACLEVCVSEQKW